MKIIYKTGDALKGPERFTCHGCNSRGVMGSGIAAQVRKDYPPAYRVYREAFVTLADPSQGLRLGSTTHVLCTDGRTIINAVTQADFGRDPNRVYVSYEAFPPVLRSISNIVAAAGYGPEEPVAFPLIGAGLANGSWTRIAELIETHSQGFQPVVYLFDGKMPVT